MRINRKQKELIKMYVLLFAALVVAMNWSADSWIFNYREVAGLAYDFFNPYPESPVLAASQPKTISPGSVAQAASVVPAAAASYPVTNADDSLQVSSIGLDTALVVGQTTDVSSLEQDLNQGVVLYPGSVQPGQPGEMVVLGHSAPLGWPHVRHDWVFSDLQKVQSGDLVILNFNHRQYTYKVTGQQIIQQGQDATLSAGQSGKNVLILISCWPPGKNYKRIAVEAELVAS